MSIALFGERGLVPTARPREDPKEALLRRAKYLRELAARGMSKLAFTREADKLEVEAGKIGNPGTVKQPWQMTRGEFAVSQNKPADNVYVQQQRDAIIKRAVRQGKPVPPEVLADYPELRAGNPSQWPEYGLANILGGTFDPMNTARPEKLASDVAEAVATGQWNEKREGVPDSVATFERLMTRAKDFKWEYTPGQWEYQYAAFKASYGRNLAEYDNLEGIEDTENPSVVKVNWGLIATLPADGVIYPGGPEYGAFRIVHKPADRHTVEALLADTGIGLQRRRLVPRA
ncbi:MAG: hypothetical protein Q8N51_04535, partial [Gammaproteobacteria bacterium]|nr:hypothetical protein [Gammaproteobacteria bacterium]